MPKSPLRDRLRQHAEAIELYLREHATDPDWRLALGEITTGQLRDLTRDLGDVADQLEKADSMVIAADPPTFERLTPNGFGGGGGGGGVPVGR